MISWPSKLIDLCEKNALASRIDRSNRVTVNTRLEREGLRESFLPAGVKLLFIGESPPASGRFFYAANSGLYRAMRLAFQIAEPAASDRNFLAMFKERGFYLTDLSPEPIDHFGAKERRAWRRHSESHLARQIKRFHPLMIAPVLLSIVKNVENAASLAGWRGPVTQLPYPGRWSRHRDAFVEAIVPIIRQLGG